VIAGFWPLLMQNATLAASGESRQHCVQGFAAVRETATRFMPATLASGYFPACRISYHLS
jgi:hypothetical protein